jgi:metallophosphoesterase superfamily enzyme
MVRFSFWGHEFVALPPAALFWPARRALLVADLHLEKATWFGVRGQMLPPYDSIATLTDLTALADSLRTLLATASSEPSGTIAS